MVRNGYLYRRDRNIPDAKERIDAFLSRISDQFDRGEDEFDKFVKPELSALIEAMHTKYVDRKLKSEAMLSYLDDAEFFMKRSARLTGARLPRNGTWGTSSGSG